jgi:hypothetical protein
MVLFFCFLAIGGAIYYVSSVKEKTESVNVEQFEAVAKIPEQRVPEKFEKFIKPKPAPVSMDRVKKQGCVTDGLLSEYNPDYPEFVDLINRSHCYYLHRAIETWLKPPDFDTIHFELSQIKKKDVVYGMFIAEALKTDAKYLNIETQKEFDFSLMCRAGSEDYWGVNTCKPIFASEEYREYIKYITHKAIDLGVQGFTFGQIYWQEDGKKDYAPGIIKDMRDYAKKNGVDIIIGAQTGAITDPKYLGLFDFIEGGVGIDNSGNIESGPCLSFRGGCWALLWHDNFAKNAKNVLLHLDWTGIKSDDLDRFARMDQNTRALTLANLYDFFNAKNMGFMMPYFGVLDKDNGGCRGPKKKFYSPDMKYTCRDEKTIDSLLSGLDVHF